MFSLIIYDYLFPLQHGRAHVLAHPTCINVIAQSLITENIKTKIQGNVSSTDDSYDKIHILVQSLVQ